MSAYIEVRIIGEDGESAWRNVTLLPDAKPTPELFAAKLDLVKTAYLDTGVGPA